MVRKVGLLLAAGLLVSISMSSQADQYSATDRDQIEGLIRDYLLENPEVIVEAIGVYQQRQSDAEAAAAARAIDELMPALAFDDNTPIGGNPDGDVTVVEFFDYRCGYCKQVGPQVQSLIESDPGVRFVYKEWPILGPESVVAARAALASREQGLYDAYHEALMNARTITEASIMEIASDVSLDIDRLTIDMQSPAIDEHLQKTRELASRLGINGTPAFVFGSELVKGAVPGGQMVQLVEAARNNQ